MKAVQINISQNGHGSTVKTDDGHEIKGITGIRVSAGMDGGTAMIDLYSNCTASIGEENVSFMVGEHRDVVALILRDGTKVDLLKGAS